MEASQRSVCSRAEGKKKERNVFQRSPLSTHETRIQKEFARCSRLRYIARWTRKWQQSCRPGLTNGSTAGRIPSPVRNPPSRWIDDAVGAEFKREKHLHPVSFCPPKLIFLVYDASCRERQTAPTFCTMNLQTRVKRKPQPGS